jgi:hypothetical protein
MASAFAIPQAYSFLQYSDEPIIQAFTKLQAKAARVGSFIHSRADGAAWTSSLLCYIHDAQ